MYYNTLYTRACPGALLRVAIRPIAVPSLKSNRPQPSQFHPARRHSTIINAKFPSDPSFKPTETSAASPAPPSIVARLATSLTRPAVICCLAAAALALFSPEAFAAAKSSKAAAVANNAAASGGAVGFAKAALDFILHLDVHLGDIIARFGPATYAILFAIVFAETGLVVTPFLPGDSLLFATGALAALGKLNIVALMAVYITAATLGDAVNYAVGNFFGARAVESKLVKKEYIARTEAFYADYGEKVIILARFVPIVRTFAPFVAGVGSMPYGKFGLYNIVGAILWTVLCTGAGYVFGNVPIVHENFSLVVLGIVAVSLLPVVFEVLAAKGGKKE